MKIKFMMGVLTYVSVALVHECHAGSLFSREKETRGVKVRDKRTTISVKPVSQLPQQDLKNQSPQQPPTPLLQQSLNNQPNNAPTSSQPTPQPSNNLDTVLKQLAFLKEKQEETHELVKKMENNSGVPQSSDVFSKKPSPEIEEKDERQTTVSVQQQSLQQSLNNQPNNTTTSSQPTPQPPTQLPQQSADNAPKVTPSPVIKTDEGTLVPYKIIKFKGHEIPYPQSAILEADEKSISLKQTACSITLLTSEQLKTHELAKKMTSNYFVPQNPEQLNACFEKIYRDLNHIGTVTNNVNDTEETIHSLKKLVQTVKLVDIYKNTRFQRSKVSLISRVMVTMDAGEVIILDVHGLPKDLWNK